MDLENINVLQQLYGHTSDVTSCDFTPNYTLITGSSDKTIRIWDWIPGTGYAERASCSPIRGHKYCVTCVKVSPQGAMLAAASVDGTATLWGLRTAQPTKLGTLVQVNGDAIRVLRFAPDSTILVTGGDNGAICIWDLIHRSLIRSIFRHEDTVQALSFSPDSQLLVSGCSTGVLHIWRVSMLIDTTLDHPPIPLTTIDNAHDLGVLCCDYAGLIQADENNPLIKIYTLASCGNDHNIKIWKQTYQITPKHLGELGNIEIELSLELEGHESAVTCLKYSANSALLASASLDKTVKIWNVDGVCLKSEENHSRYVNCIAFSRDNTLLASGSNDKSIIIWDLTASITIDSDLLKPHMQLGHMFSLVSDIIQENEVVHNAETDENEVKLIEIIDDISDGAINSCKFFGNEILATASGDKLVKLFNVMDNPLALEESCFSPFEGHTYAVNSIDFSNDGLKLVSCSQDGSAIIWHTQTGEQLSHLPENELSIRVCRFSSNNEMIITAGDDEKATIWNTETMEMTCGLEGHSDSITSASFTPDDLIVATVCNNGDFRLWGSAETTLGSCLYVQDDAHDLGVQCCDFSQNLEPIPNMSNVDNLNYLLATCGNDSLVKLWKISIPKIDAVPRYDLIDVKPFRSLMGHGGNVMSVKFSPKTGEIVCSTATDRQARLWSVYSSECVHVLDHNAMTISCSFSANMSMLAIGCLDKTLWLWNLPQQLIFQTIVANKIRCKRKSLIDWRTEDFAQWARDLGMNEIADKFLDSTLDGQKVLLMYNEEICETLELDTATGEEFMLQLKWLKQDELQPSSSSLTDSALTDVPEEFLCPITHEIMRTPVNCSDGFTYEKQAITEWFLSGKFTSPMTNELLPNTDYHVNHELRTEIHKFLYDKQE